ncbi:hypothetical protein [Plastoroseomonas hellenica]|uniref:hypothetical protein n=1 Tax=Plastoroseomonas hellenica TaxID=2687306 RepID=UPI001BAAB13A|nr:hypothetical protein [Plastoroseomonas hellenica]MBR0646397.1 hypothetical protein [Plastoroseomonas hellenica]
MDSRATGNLIGLQAGFDILRTQPYAGGHRDHAGICGHVLHADAPDRVFPALRDFVRGERAVDAGT